MKLKHFFTILSIATMGACTEEPESGVIQPTPEQPTIIEKSTGYIKGADVSWLTEMEANNILFYDANGIQTECMTLLKGIGFNTIRLRVWVNPADGWCNKSDLLAKAIRAQKLGMRIMVDFHYSDVWADPANQKKPAAWDNYTYNELLKAVSDHTTEVLSMLKNSHIDVEYVQIGNETGTGMMKTQSDGTILTESDAYGDAGTYPTHYAQLNNAGYDAAKAVFPNCKTIIHIQNGQTLNKFIWIFNILKNNGGKWDVIGLSLYPEADTWQSFNDDCINNINSLINTYNCEVMLCEVGLNANESQASYNYLNDLISRTKQIDKCLGVCYWEPQSCDGWKSYGKGAFINGQPTTALDAFK